jgi:hypothetical protein
MTTRRGSDFCPQADSNNKTNASQDMPRMVRTLSPPVQDLDRFAGRRLVFGESDRVEEDALTRVREKLLQGRK